MARIGYARVSTLDQDLDVQLAKLKAEGCGVIRSEKVSGGSRDGRTELATVLEFLRPGDELVVTRLDRLGRDTRDGIQRAKGEGVYAGGKRRVDRDRIRSLHAAGSGPAAIAKAVGCSRMQVYRVLQEQ